MPEDGYVKWANRSSTLDSFHKKVINVKPNVQSRIPLSFCDLPKLHSFEVDFKCYTCDNTTLTFKEMMLHLRQGHCIFYSKK